MNKFIQAATIASFIALSACGTELDQQVHAGPRMAASPVAAATAAPAPAPAALNADPADLIYVNLGGWNCGNYGGRLIRVDLGACNWYGRWRR